MPKEPNPIPTPIEDGDDTTEKCGDGGPLVVIDNAIIQKLIRIY